MVENIDGHNRMYSSFISIRDKIRAGGWGERLSVTVYRKTVSKLEKG